MAKKVMLYHGFWTEFSIDRELDWHVYIDVPDSTKRVLMTHLQAIGCNVTYKSLKDVYSEHMVLDSPKEFGDDPATRLIGYRSADVSLALRLEGSKHPAWDLGLIAARHQHKSQDFSKYSRLCTDPGYVYLQGAFVNDAHHLRPGEPEELEIHPLDSIAFVIDKNGKTLSTTFGQRDWPNDHVRWRVAVFTNSSLHRINKCSYLQKERTTTWYLPLPGDAYSNQSGHAKNINVVPIRHRLWNGVQGAWYESRGVKSIDTALDRDPRDGLKKLKIAVTMNAPDKLGGMFIRDYVILTQ